MSRPGALRVARWWVLDWVYATLWQLRSLGPTDTTDYETGDGQPIVVVPGVYETWHFLLPLMDALHERGHPVYVVTALRHNRRPVVDSARTVMDRITALGLTDVVVLAHSKGGLIGKYAMGHLDGGDSGAPLDGGAGVRRIDRLVAVAAPFDGSTLARFGGIPSLRAFRASDPTIAGLMAEVSVNTRITSIRGVFDSLIPNGSELVGATNIVLDVGGHFRILGDRRTRDAVVRAVDA